ncbi:TPA: hypothetical protein N0F65_008216 [Lagenidium giganteum]|uniref:Uncharacterized protein n=1 Tax=Lagenidium giganteum TaxID=4803 RepID=A0AAV2YZF2_9STRA|nr:TPA: hypothetical protein N0F65_008216 [Lagenidium giganteum]
MTSPLRTDIAQLQELTRKVQEERDRVREENDELRQALSEERGKREALEGDLQVKELSVLHLQQRLKEREQSSAERLLLLEKELEEEKSMHKVTAMGRNVAANKNTTLSNEIRRLESKLRKQGQHNDELATEVEALREHIRSIAAERDGVVAKTEGDAKRVRELWEHIVQEHEAQTTSLRREVEASNEAQAQAQKALQECQQKLLVAQQTIEHAHKDNAKAIDLERKLEAMRGEAQQKDDASTELKLKIQDLENRVLMAQERQHQAQKSELRAKEELSVMMQQLEDKTEALLALKTEFSDLLDKYEHIAEVNKQQRRHDQAAHHRKLQQLRRSKKHAEEIAGMRKKEIHECKRVIHSIDNKLNDLNAKNKAADMNTWSLNGVPKQQPKSLSIYRH